MSIAAHDGLTPRYQSGRASGVTPEVELLLCCCRVNLDRETKSRILALVDGSMDWPRFMEYVHQARVVPLVYRHLSAVCPEAVPEAQMQVLVTQYGENVLRNKLFADELVKLANAFAAAGVPLMTIKGLALAETVYGDLNLRHFWDLDLLVKPEDWDALPDVLRTLDYHNPADFSPLQDRAFRLGNAAYGFIRGDDKIEIDAHWRLLPKSWTPDIDYAGLWSRATTVNLPAGPVPAMSYEDEIIYLSMHGSKEKWWRLRMLCDFAESLRVRPDLDWDKVLKNAEKQGASRIFLLGVYMAWSWMGAPVPERVLERARSDDTLMNLENVTWEAFQSNDLTRPTLATFSTYRYRLLPRMKDKLSYVFRVIFMPKARHVGLVKLPEGLFFLYVPIKLVHDYVALPIWLFKKKLSQ